MTEHQWYYARGATRGGPVPYARLRELAAAGAVAPGDLVWSDGRPEAVAPAATWAGLVPPAPPAAGATGISPPPDPPPWLRAVAWACDAAAAVAQAGLYVLGAVVLVAVLGGLFCGKGPRPTPPTAPAARPLPVAVEFRASAIGRGLVLRVRNTSDRPLDDLIVSVTAGRGPTAGQVTRGMTRPLGPGEEVEIGWAELDGWQLAPGEVVKLWVPGPGYAPVELTVPVKAAGR